MQHIHIKKRIIIAQVCAIIKKTFLVDCHTAANMFYRSPDPAFRVILSVSEGSSHFRKRKDSSSLRSSE